MTGEGGAVAKGSKRSSSVYKIGIWDNESARRWAQRKKFRAKELVAFDDFLEFLETVFVNPAEISGNVRIDEGAFGSIEKCKWRNQYVVVKKVQQDVTNRKTLPQILRECLLELKVLRGLKHPNIVKFLGAAVHFPTDVAPNQDLHLGLVFEFCEKSSLSNNLRKFKVKFPFLTKLRFARDIAAGMEYLHSHSIIHRDLNTRNVLLNAQDEIKICDFGFARCCERGSYDSTTISGTAEYMPPEQLYGNLLTLKADVWAMGTVIWELATEKAPWGHIKGDVHTVLTKRVGDAGERLPPLAPTDVPAEFREEYIRIMSEAMSTNPNDRPHMAVVHERLKALYKAAGGKDAVKKFSMASLFSCVAPPVAQHEWAYPGKQIGTFEIVKTSKASPPPPVFQTTAPKNAAAKTGGKPPVGPVGKGPSGPVPASPFASGSVPRASTPTSAPPKANGTPNGPPPANSNSRRTSQMSAGGVPNQNGAFRQQFPQNQNGGNQHPLYMSGQQPSNNRFHPGVPAASPYQSQSQQPLGMATPMSMGDVMMPSPHMQGQPHMTPQQQRQFMHGGSFY